MHQGAETEPVGRPVIETHLQPRRACADLIQPQADRPGVVRDQDVVSPSLSMSPNAGFPPSMRLKSPVRKSAVGTENRLERFTRWNVPSQFAKKNSLFLMMGPPRFAPSSCWLSFGLSVTPPKFSSQVKARKRIVAVAGEHAAAKIVGPRLRDHGNGRAAGHALLGVEVVGGNVDFLDALHRRDVHRVVRHRDQDVGRPIQTGVVRAPLLAVDVGRQRTSRRVGDGVLKLRRRGAGNQIEQGLVVAIVRERQISRSPAP